MEKLHEMSANKKQQLGLTGDWWEDSDYRVLRVASERWNGLPVIQISIKRHDGKPIDPPWRVKQSIKNQIVGEDREGVEIYPAKSRLNDQTNAYHLWVIDDPTFRFPFGWKGKAILDDGETREE
jgi:hypothetical protein